MEKVVFLRGGLLLLIGAGLGLRLGGAALLLDLGDEEALFFDLLLGFGLGAGVDRFLDLEARVVHRLVLIGWHARSPPPVFALPGHHLFAIHLCTA